MRLGYVLALILFTTTPPSFGRLVNVTAYSARGDGHSDDTTAINDAVSASRVGDTIYFPAGFYHISYPGILLLHSRTYRGSDHGRSVLIGGGGYALSSSQYDKGYDITIEYLTFDGGGLRFDGDNVPVRHIIVAHCTFRNIVTNNANWTTHMGIFIGPGAEYSKFIHNHFQNIFTDGKYDLQDRDATGIFGYGLSRSVIAENVFDMVNEGIHIFFDRTEGHDVSIVRNRLTRVHRIAIECQNSHLDRLIVEGNMVSHPLYPYWLTYGISIAASSVTGNGILIRNNTVLADTALDLSKASGNYYPYGIEAWGTNTVVRGNRIIGLWGIGIGIGAARHMLVEKNLICGESVKHGKAIDEYYGPQIGTVRKDNIIIAECPSSLLALYPMRSNE